MAWYEWFLDAIFDHYIDFEDRVGREPFWSFVLSAFVVIASFIALIFLFNALELDFLIGIMSLLIVLFLTAILLPFLSICARRMHDINKTGWLCVIAIIPIVGWALFALLAAKEGDVGENDYGFDPKTEPIDASDYKSKIKSMSEMFKRG